MAIPDYLAIQQDSSWRGVRFATTEYSIKTGREIALHRYAFKDLPWPEDMSKALQVYSFSGFVGGTDNWMDDFLALKSACEDQKGADVLVHPFLGTLNAACVGAVFTAGYQEQRLHRVQLEFIICAPERERARVLNVKKNTLGGIKGLIGDAEAAVASDFVAGARDAFGRGAGAVSSIRAIVQGYVGEALRLTRDATGALNAVRGVGGALGINMGRFDAGPLGTITGSLGQIGRTLGQASRLDLGVKRAIYAAGRARAGVESIADRLSNTLGGL